MIYHLGTSGWSYQDWKGRFYPTDIPQKNWLSFYARTFNTVEINMTFYRYPKPDTLKAWLDKTPKDFTFTLKANRQITHLKRIKGVKNEVRYFYVLADSLRDRLGCILFQLPPSLTLDLGLLKDFLSHLSSDHRNVLEFRHQSWYVEDVFEMLRVHKVIFCVVSSPQLPEDIIETAETAYFRFHGRVGWYKYDYSDDELKDWAEAIKKIKAKEFFIYFNNDYQAYAAANCKNLEKYLRTE